MVATTNSPTEASRVLPRYPEISGDVECSRWAAGAEDDPGGSPPPNHDGRSTM